MKSKTLLVAAALSAALFAEAAKSTPFDKMSLKGRTDKENPVSYKVGEPIVFTLFTTDIDAVPTNDTYRIRWTRKGDDGKYAEGFAPFVIGETCVVTTKMDRPGFVRLEASLVGSDGRKVMRACRAPGMPGWVKNYTVFFDGGAGVNVGEIRQEKPEPEDFDAWWAEQKRILATVPMKATRRKFKEVNGCTIYELSVDCFGPRPVTGYLFIPKDARPKGCKARVAFQGYGFYKQGCPEWAGGRCTKEREVFLEINAHGYELGRDQAYYDEFGKGIRTEKYSYAFSPEENAKPETAYFRFMAMRVMRALEYMKSLPEWNGKDLIAEGGSQGGLQTSWAAGLDKDVSLARPSVTWCCDIGVSTGKRLFGPWRIPWAEGLGYFDSINHIRRAKCPVEITRAGLGDYTCPPSGLAAYYNAIPGRKSIYWVQGSQHGYVPPAPNQAVTLGNWSPTGGESKSKSASKDVK